MSETMQTMAQRIAKEIHRGNLLTTDIYQYILDAIKMYRNEPFYQSEGIFNFNTKAIANPGPDNFVFPDQHEIYPLPQNYIEMLGITVLFNGTSLPLNVRSLDWFLEQCEGNPVVTGPPTDYLIYNENIYLWPLPDQVYQTTVWYKAAKAPPHIDKPEEIGNFWMIHDREMLIRSTAKALLYAQKLRDQKNAQVEQAISVQLFLKIQGTTYGNLFSGSPKPHDW